MKKVVMAVGFAAMVALAAFGRLPENCMIKDSLYGEDGNGRPCDNIDISIVWRDLTCEELRLGETSGLTERHSMLVGEITSQSGQPVRKVNAVDVDKYMREIRIPKLSIRPPAKLDDALLYLQTASAPFDGSGRILLFALAPLGKGQTYPPMPEIEATDISLHSALQLVVYTANARYSIREDGVVVVVPKSWVCKDGGIVHVLHCGEWPSAENRDEHAEDVDTTNRRSDP